MIFAGFLRELILSGLTFTLLVKCDNWDTEDNPLKELGIRERWNEDGGGGGGGGDAALASIGGDGGGVAVVTGGKTLDQDVVFVVTNEFNDQRNGVNRNGNDANNDAENDVNAGLDNGVDDANNDAENDVNAGLDNGVDDANNNTENDVNAGLDNGVDDEIQRNGTTDSRRHFRHKRQSKAVSPVEQKRLFSAFSSSKFESNKRGNNLVENRGCDSQCQHVCQNRYGGRSVWSEKLCLWNCRDQSPFGCHSKCYQGCLLFHGNSFYHPCLSICRLPADAVADRCYDLCIHFNGPHWYSNCLVTECRIRFPASPSASSSSSSSSSSLSSSSSSASSLGHSPGPSAYSSSSRFPQFSSSSSTFADYSSSFSSHSSSSLSPSFSSSPSTTSLRLHGPCYDSCTRFWGASFYRACLPQCVFGADISVDDNCFHRCIAAAGGGGGRGVGAKGGRGKDSGGERRKGRGPEGGARNLGPSGRGFRGDGFERSEEAAGRGGRGKGERGFGDRSHRVTTAKSGRESGERRRYPRERGGRRNEAGRGRGSGSERWSRQDGRRERRSKYGRSRSMSVSHRSCLGKCIQSH